MLRTSPMRRLLIICLCVLAGLALFEASLPNLHCAQNRISLHPAAGSIFDLYIVGESTNGRVSLLSEFPDIRSRDCKKDVPNYRIGDRAIVMPYAGDAGRIYLPPRHSTGSEGCAVVTKLFPVWFSFIRTKRGLFWGDPVKIPTS